jgi:hypothetical protein
VEQLIVALAQPQQLGGAALTAGFVWWVTRGGGLLATAVMGVPAWRQIDLLPVMTAGGDDEDDTEPDDDADGAPGRAEAADAVEALFDRDAVTPA